MKAELQTENYFLAIFIYVTESASILTFDGGRRKKKGRHHGGPERKRLFEDFASKQSIAIAVLDQMVQRAAASADQRSGRGSFSTTSRSADACADGGRSGDGQDGLQLGIASTS